LRNICRTGAAIGAAFFNCVNDNFHLTLVDWSEAQEAEINGEVNYEELLLD